MIDQWHFIIAATTLFLISIFQRRKRKQVIRFPALIGSLILIMAFLRFKQNVIGELVIFIPLLILIGLNFKRG